MTVEIFLFLLTVFSVITSLITEAVKKALGDVKYSPNLLVLLIATFVGVCGTIIYYVVSKTPLYMSEYICVPLMAIANWLCAMLGYDKVMQAIYQVTNK